MNRDEIAALLDLLADELGRREVRGELLIVGGAAIALAYADRRVTADLDAVFEPKRVVYDAAERIAADHGLDPDWLNDAVKAFVPGPDPNAMVYFDRPALVVRVASARVLLAMKLLASRVERDQDDIALLLPLAGVSTVEQGLALVRDLYPAAIVPTRVQYLLAELLEPRN